MKILDVLQNTPEWLEARLGIPTASQFFRIITPGGKPSSASDKYLAELLVEWAFGSPQDTPESPWMTRGHDLEEEAAAYFAFEYGLDVQRVGFVLRDDGWVGCSPDRLIGEDAILEIKAPGAVQHIENYLDCWKDAYAIQCQGQLWIAERKKSFLLSYNQVLPNKVKETERDDGFISKLETCVNEFVERVKEGRAKLLADGVVPVRPVPRQVKVVFSGICGNTGRTYEIHECRGNDGHDAPKERAVYVGEMCPICQHAPKPDVVAA